MSHSVCSGHKCDEERWNSDTQGLQGETGKVTKFNAAEIGLRRVIIGFVLQENGESTHKNR